MKKTVFLLLFGLFSLATICQNVVRPVGVLVDLTVQIVDPFGNGHPIPKSPAEAPTVSLDDHTLYIYDVAYDFTLMLVDENDDVIYSTFVPANTASVVLPSTLTGTYTLQLIPNGTYYFEGEIEL